MKRRLIGLGARVRNCNRLEKPLDILVNDAGCYGIPRDGGLVRAEDERRRAQLWDKAQMIARTLSGGRKRRLRIARAMMTRPRLLILDEPTAGVDIEIRRDMWKTLREINASGTTIILTTHYLEEAESLCRNLAIIDRGTIVAHGPMRTLLARLDVEGFLFDVDGALPEVLPEIEGATLVALDRHTLDLDMPRAMDLNRVFAVDGGVAGWRAESEGAPWVGLDRHTLDLDMPRAMDLNRVFAVLGEAGIRVRSMRTKSNRLEELFVRMTGSNAAQQPGKAA